MEPSMQFLAFLIGIGFLVFVAYEWKKKTAFYKTISEAYWVRKDEQPGKFWLTLAVQIFIVIFCLAVGLGLYVPK